MTYPSKKDKWIAFIILPIILVTCGGGVFLLCLAATQVLPFPILIPGLILLGVSGLTLWAYFTASCEITSADLIVRFGPLWWNIPLEGITKVLPKRGFSPDWAWGVAWSTDRVVICYRNRKGANALLGVAISPADKEGFLRDLAEAIEKRRLVVDKAEAKEEGD